MDTLRNFNIYQIKLAEGELDDVLKTRIYLFNKRFAFEELRVESSYLNKKNDRLNITEKLENEGIIKSIDLAFVGPKNKFVFISNLDFFEKKKQLIYEFGEVQYGRYILNQLAIIGDEPWGHL